MHKVRLHKAKKENNWRKNNYWELFPRDDRAGKHQSSGDQVESPHFTRKHSEETPGRPQLKYNAKLAPEYYSRPTLN